VNLSGLTVSEFFKAPVGQHSTAGPESNAQEGSHSDMAVWGPGSKEALVLLHWWIALAEELGCATGGVTSGT